MKNEVAFTIRLDAKVAKQLEKLSKGLNRSKNYLLKEAAANYVSERSYVLENLAIAKHQLDSGEGVEHKQAMKKLSNFVKKLK